MADSALLATRRERLRGARPARSQRGDVEDQSVGVTDRHAVGGDLGQQERQHQPLCDQSLHGRRVGRRIEPVRIERHQVDDHVQPAERLGDRARKLHDAVGVAADRPVHLDIKGRRRHHFGDALHGLAFLSELQDEARPVVREGAGHIDAAGTGNPGDEHALAGKLGVGGSRPGTLDDAHQHWFPPGSDAWAGLGGVALRICCRFA